MGTLMTRSAFVLVTALALAAAPRADQAAGTVAEIFPDKMQFVVADKDGLKHNFSMAENARVLINDAPAVLEDMMIGDRVGVAYRLDEAKKMATEVRCKR